MYHRYDQMSREREKDDTKFKRYEIIQGWPVFSLHLSSSFLNLLQYRFSFLLFNTILSTILSTIFYAIFSTLFNAI